MGSILLFPSREAIARRKPRAQPADAGRILLFTGVRYEHWSEPEPSAPASARPAPRRRTRSRRQA